MEFNPKSFEGKVVLITGSAREIGREPHKEGSLQRQNKASDTSTASLNLRFSARLIGASRIQSALNIKPNMAIRPQTPPTVKAEPIKKINPYFTTFSSIVIVCPPPGRYLL